MNSTNKGQLVRVAGAEQLPEINRIIASSVQRWPCSDRLKRLALEPLRYRPCDLPDFEFFLCYKAHAFLGAAIWQPEVRLKTDQGSAEAVLLHGLFVDEKAQGQGVGRRLLDEVAHRAVAQNFSGIYVRAERFSTSYFKQVGFRQLAREEGPGAASVPYPYRFLFALGEVEP